MLHTVAYFLLISLRSISLAMEVAVYDRFDYVLTPHYKRDPSLENCCIYYMLRSLQNNEPSGCHQIYNKEPQNLEPVAVSQFPWKFGYSSSYVFFIDIYIKNKSPSVTTINGTYQLDNKTFEVEKFTQRNGRRKDCDACESYGCVVIVDLVNKCDGPPLATETQMSTTTENAGTDVETMNPNNTYTLNSSTNLEITTYKNSAIDTKNAKHGSSQNIVLIYVIPYVIGMCVIILVIYLISVKKYCHRNSGPGETIELNTSSTANEVVYADLGFVHGNSQPPRSNEESPYAQIIGVLKPVDGNVNNK